MAYNPPLINTEYIFYITLEDFANAGTIKANPTLAAGDIVTSLDGGAFGNVDAQSVSPASGKAVKITLSAAQMNGSNVVVIASDQTSPKEWADFSINIQPVTAAWSTITTAQVNAEVVDALNVDTYGEPTGAPTATASLASKLGRLYQALRNKVTVTASAKTIFDDADSALWSKSLTDDGTTYTEAEGS